MDDSLIARMIETAALAKEKAEERASPEMLEALERLGSLLCVQASWLRGALAHS